MHIIACFDLTQKQQEQQQQQLAEQQVPQQPQTDVFEFFIPTNVVNSHEEPLQQQPIIETSMNNLTISDYFSCSPSSLSSSSFSSNASDGTCTPVSYYGDNTSERSETPSSLTNISLNDLSMPSNNNSQTSTSPSKSGGAYCGYVESYPYYYKLNRLYNALAIQKIQGDKLKKMMRNKQSANISPASKSPCTTPAPSITTTATNSIQIPKNRGQKGQKQQNLNRKYQQKASTVLGESCSPTTGYQHLTVPQQFINSPNNFYQMSQLLTNSELIAAQANANSTLTVSSSPLTPTPTATTTSPTATNDQTTLFDTMNWLRGPDLVKSKN